MRENPVRKLYAYDRVAKRSICKVDECGRAISGNHASNLGRHIKRFHPEQFILLSMELDSVSSSPSSSSHSYYGTSNGRNYSPKEEANSSPYPNNIPTQEQLVPSTLAPINTSTTTTAISNSNNNSSNVAQQPGKFLKVRMDREKLMDALAEMVTLGGLPFSVMNDPGFRRIIDPLALAMVTAKSSSSSYTVTCEDLELYVTAKANLLRNSIRENLKNAVLILKLDILLAEGTSKIFLACHAFVAPEGSGRRDLKSYALDVRDITDVHPVQGVGNCLKRCLADFSLKLHQVYRVQTDFCTGHPPSNNNNNNDSTRDFLDPGGEDCSFERQPQHREIGEEEMERQNCMNRAVLEACKSAGLFGWAAQNDSGQDGLLCSTCPARALEDVMRTGLENAEVKGILAKARTVVRKLRNPTFALYLKKLNLPIPPDLEDGRNSGGGSEGSKTRDMVETLVLRLQEFCRDFGQLNPELHLEQGEWSALGQLLDVLRILSAGLTNVNTRLLRPGDFYSTWEQCSTDIGSLKTCWAKIFTNALEETLQCTLLKEPLFKACLYLDPKAHGAGQNLDLGGTDEVVETLTQTWLFVRHFEARKQVENSMCEEVSEPVSSIKLEDQKNWTIDEVRAFIKAELDKYLTDEHKVDVNLTEDDHSNWMIQYYPELYKIHKTLQTIPYTRATLPKGFSSMNYSLSSIAADLSPTLLNDVLLIRNNTDSTNPQISQISRFGCI